MQTVSPSDALLLISILGLASGVASVTIAQSAIFRPLRQWVRGLRPAKSDDTTWFLGELISCPYCLGHWISAVFAFQFFGYVGWFVLWLAVTAVSAIVSGVIIKLYGS